LVGGIYRVFDTGTATFNLSGSEGLDIQDATIEAIGTVTNRGKTAFQSGVLTGGQVNANNTIFQGGFVNAPEGSFAIDIGSEDKKVEGLVLNQGIVTQQNLTTLFVEGNNGKFVNHSSGFYRATGNSEITFGSEQAGSFENAGGVFSTRLATGQTTSSFIVDIPFNVSHGGTVSVDADTELILNGTGTHTGTGFFDVDGTLSLNGAQTFDGNFKFEGPGETVLFDSVVLASGEVVLKQGTLRSGASNFDVTSTGGSLVIEGGRFEWKFGDISAPNAPADTDTLVNRGGQVIFFDTTLFRILSNATMRNTGNGATQGTVIQQVSFRLPDSVIFNDTGGVWRSEAKPVTGSFISGVNGRFVNNGGTFIASGSTLTKMDVRFDLNGGTVRVEEGTLEFAQGGNSVASDPLATVDFQVAAGATLEMSNVQDYMFDGIYEATGEGTFLISDHASLLTNDLFTLNLTGDGKAVFEGGSAGGINPKGLLINKGITEWRTGLLFNFRNDPGAALNIIAGPANTTPKRFDGPVTDNKGIINHALGATVDIAPRGPGVGDITNSGIYNLHGEFVLVHPPDFARAFQNLAGGQFRLNEPGAVRTYEGQFINNGLVETAANSTLRLLDVPDNLKDHNGSSNGLLVNGRWVAKAGSRIELNGSNAGRITRNEADITLRGNGRITNLPDAEQGDINLDLENGGTLRFLENTVYHVPGDFVNDDGSTLEIDTTSELFIAGNFESVSGSTTIINNMLHVDGSFINDGGSFSGSGHLEADEFKHVAGTINPGNSPGTLTFDSNYTQSSAAGLTMEIAGLTSGTEHDVLVINGDASLAGDITFRFIDDFAPTMGQTFDLIEVRDPDTGGSGVVTGMFDTFTVENLEPGFLFDTQFNSGVFTLTALNDGQFIPEPSSAVILGLMGLVAFRRSRSSST